MRATLLLLCACAEQGALDTSNPAWCDPRTLATGELRARRMPCRDEAPLGGDGRSGDWLIENARSRYVVRGAYAPLTRLSGAGGTLIDAALVGGQDVLVEATPLFGDLCFEEVEISAWNEDDAAGLDLVGTLSDGTAAELRYTLQADALDLQIGGADGLLVVPPAGSAAVGATYEAGADALEPGEAPLFGADGALTDLGGWLLWRGAERVVVGARQDVHEAIWLDSLDVDGEAEGIWVEALDEAGATLARLPVADGAFAGRVPAETAALRATADGYAPGEGALPGQGLALALGAPGVLRVRVADDAGQDIPATLLWHGQAWPLPAGGGEALVGPGAGTALVTAGPAYQARAVEAMSISGVTELELVLERVVPDALLAQFGRPAWPDPAERRRPEDVLFEAAAEGVGFAVLSATDEVATVAFDRHTAASLVAEAGSTAATDALGALLAWPWTQDPRDPAHGAADWPGLSASALFGYMSNGADRLVVVEPAWVAAAGSPTDWPLSPRGLRLAGLEDLAPYTALLDAWVPIAAVGPRTWIEGAPVPPTPEDVGALLVAGQTVATNGPYLALRVDGQGPGGQVSAMRTHEIQLTVEAPAWLPLSGAALITTGGEKLARWTLSGEEQPRLDAHLTRALPEGWILAIAWGEADNPPLLDAPAWAVTSPVWIGRP